MATLVTKKFEELTNTGNNGYSLPIQVLATIRSLCEEIGCSDDTQNTYVNQYNANVGASSAHASGAHAKPKEYDGRANFTKQQARKNAAEWKAKNGFQVTKFSMVDNSQALIDGIRSNMNKLSDKNIDTKLEELKTNIDEIVETTDEDEDDLREKMTKIFEVVFNASTSNKLPTIYARVYGTIYEKQPRLIQEFMDNKLNAHNDSMTGIVDVSEENYDEFCEFTLKNTNRKNASALFCEIAKANAIPSITIEHIDTLFDRLLEQVICNIETKSKQKEVDETTENLVVMFASLGKHVDKSKYADRFKTISGYKTGEKPGLSSRAKFKYMDLIKM